MQPEKQIVVGTVRSLVGEDYLKEDVEGGVETR